MIGMKVTLGLDSTPEEAIAEFRRRAEEQGASWVKGTERASFIDYEYRTEDVEGLQATDVRGGIFSLFVNTYERFKTQRTRFTGAIWGVRADEPPAPTWPTQITAGPITDDTPPQEWT